MKLTILPAIFLLFFVWSCNKAKPQKVATKQEIRKVSFEIQSIQKELGNCADLEEPCSKIEMRFPLLKNVPTPIAVSVNRQIYRELIQTLVFEEKPESPSEELLLTSADSFLNEWKIQVENSLPGESPPGWYVNVDGEPGLITQKVVALSLAVNSFAGGAHPNAYISLYNFDLKTGNKITYQDIFSDLSALEKIAESKFRTSRNIPMAANLNELGFFWDGPFSLPENFELQNDGILFWYNPYEIASYAEGPTDFIIPYSELKSIFKKDNVF